MNEIMSEEAINELIDGFEIVGSLTEYGRKNIKYHFQRLQQENQQLKSVIKEIREYINSYDVFKAFSFPLMKRDKENQIKSSIKYEFDTSIKKALLQILDKTKDNE